MKPRTEPPRPTSFERRPAWYKDAVIYQVHAKSFFDANGDGMGDLRGLIQKLDYIRELGASAIWLLPFYPSPWRDDGYDISDYKDVHPAYGSLADFKALLDAAHRRKLHVITELVINHTSDQHPWFQRARRAPAGSSERDFYVWSDDAHQYADARIIFRDFETSNWTWDPIAQAYFWHRFYSHQPDLNFDNPAVHDAVLEALDFWLELGVDGLRLDAIPYLYERPGTNCENLPETHDFLRKLRAHVDARWPNRMLLAEANQWPEDAVQYFGAGDECHMAFHFPLMPRLYMAVEMEDRFPLVDILEQTPAIPEQCQWAIFLRNHDELTLEMVTDEERDYMYRVFAKDKRARINLGIRRRLAPLLGNDRRKIELLNALLFSLPGTPVLYYGDEIGMGDNYYLGDRNGVRTPMQWSPDRNSGFSPVSSQQLYLPLIIDHEYHYEAVNVETQERNPSSLLWWMRQRISLRNRHPAFGQGTLEFLSNENQRIVCFLRKHETEVILVVANLADTPQTVQIDLSRYAGSVPIELTGRARFPSVNQTPYVLMLAGHQHLWLSLFGPGQSSQIVPEVPSIGVTRRLRDIFSGELELRLTQTVLPKWLASRRWFRSKTRELVDVAFRSVWPFLHASPSGDPTYFCLVEARFSEGDPERYALPLCFAPAHEQAPDWARIAELTVGERAGWLCDAAHDSRFRAALLSFALRGERLEGTEGYLQGLRSSQAALTLAEPIESSVLGTDQSNTAFVYPSGYFLKLFRQVEEGTNPDPEVIQFLSERTSFKNSPSFEAAIEIRDNGQPSTTVALVQGLVRAERDAWSFALENMGRFLSGLETDHKPSAEPPRHAGRVTPVSFHELSEFLQEGIGGALAELTHVLGVRTAELHQALASREDVPDFAPEPYSQLYQRSVYQSVRGLLKRNFALLSRLKGQLPAETLAQVELVLTLEPLLLQVLQRLTRHKIEVDKIRIHGDYHLGQVLFTGKDFVILDFEGEPARPSSERRLKRSALRDVASMLRSFHYAAHAGLRHHSQTKARDPRPLVAWAEQWYHGVAGIFLKAYLDTARGSRFIPSNEADTHLLLDVFAIEKAVYEIGYEANNRPAWLPIPLAGLAACVEEAAVPPA